MGNNTTSYTQKLADEICGLLKQGHTLRAACRLHPDTPAESTVREWVHDDRNGFTAQYLRAREIGYLAMADELVEIADDGANDTYEDDEGNIKTNYDVLGRSKLRCDQRQWLLSKALPKVYGQKVTTELTGADGAPLFGEDERARRVAALRERVKERIAQNNAEPNDASDLA